MKDQNNENMTIMLVSKLNTSYIFKSWFFFHNFQASIKHYTYSRGICLFHLLNIVILSGCKYPNVYT